MVNHVQMNYGEYALFLKQTKSCDIKYGRKSYDYGEGTVVCFAPGQTVSVETIEDEVSPAVYRVVFHPDLIRGTSLGENIKNYSFFSYAVNEALHLSDQEKQIVMDCLKKISIELAKEHMAETKETVSQIAYTLGFQYPQHLCRLFKNGWAAHRMNTGCNSRDNLRQTDYYNQITATYTYLYHGRDYKS